MHRETSSDRTPRHMHSDKLVKLAMHTGEAIPSMEHQEVQPAIHGSSDRAATAVKGKVVKKSVADVTPTICSRLSAPDAMPTYSQDAADSMITPSATHQRKIMWATRALAIVLLAVGIVQWEHAARLHSKVISVQAGSRQD